MSVDGEGAGKDSTQSGEYQNTRCDPMRFSMRFYEVPYEVLYEVL